MKYSEAIAFVDKAINDIETLPDSIDSILSDLKESVTIWFRKIDNAEYKNKFEGFCSEVSELKASFQDIKKKERLSKESSNFIFVSKNKINGGAIELLKNLKNAITNSFEDQLKNGLALGVNLEDIFLVCDQSKDNFIKPFALAFNENDKKIKNLQDKIVNLEKSILELESDNIKQKNLNINLNNEINQKHELIDGLNKKNIVSIQNLRQSKALNWVLSILLFLTVSSFVYCLIRPSKEKEAIIPAQINTSWEAEKLVFQNKIKGDSLEKIQLRNEIATIRQAPSRDSSHHPPPPPPPKIIPIYYSIKRGLGTQSDIDNISEKIKSTYKDCAVAKDCYDSDCGQSFCFCVRFVAIGSHKVQIDYREGSNIKKLGEHDITNIDLKNLINTSKTSCSY